MRVLIERFARVKARVLIESLETLAWWFCSIWTFWIGLNGTTPSSIWLCAPKFSEFPVRAGGSCRLQWCGKTVED